MRAIRTSSTQNLASSRALHVVAILVAYSGLYVLFFSPVLFSGRLLAPFDGILVSVPAFYAPRTLWTNFFFGGSPAAADPVVQAWYPLSLFFSLIPRSWNAFMISAYVLASCFTYGYIYTVTRSKLAGFSGGIIFGMSGFMMAHLGHSSMVHTAAWMPLAIWALEKLRREVNAVWFGIAILAVANNFLAVHPQISVYTLGLSIAYAGLLGWSSAIGRWKYYGLCIAAITLGLSIAAIQLFPLIELSNRSLRVHFSFQDFVSYAVPLPQAITLLFPSLFGSSSGTNFYNTYWGAWNLTEMSGYVGLLPLMLGIIGLLSYRKNSITWFWACAGLVAFLLVLGDSTPLAQFVYHVPAYNKFRVPARHFVEIALAVSVLSGFGIRAIQSCIVSRALLMRTVAASSVTMLACLAAILWFQDQLKARAVQFGISTLPVLPWSNPSLGVPLMILIAAGFALICWSRRTDSPLRVLLLLSVLVVDLGSFGWFSTDWREWSPREDVLKPPAVAEEYKGLLYKTHQRMIPFRGAKGSRDEIPPDMSWLWGVPSASGYGPLMLSRTSQALSMTNTGEVTHSIFSADDRSADIMAVRYIFVPRSIVRPSPTLSSHGVSWSPDDLAIALGSGCGIIQPDAAKFHIAEPFVATSIGIISKLACSVTVPDDTEVLGIRLRDTQGRVRTLRLLAGRDTSEWAHDCSDVLPLIQHRLAPIFRSYTVTRNDRDCQGHDYVAVLSLEEAEGFALRDIEFTWTAPSGAIVIHKVNLINERNGTTYALSPMERYLVGSDRWRHVKDVGGVSIYENLRAMPRAWLVSEVVSAGPEEVLQAIKTSRMPGERTFDPYKVALVEEPLVIEARHPDPTATAQVVRLDEGSVEVHTQSASPAFLILSDIYYPGWRATIDGTATHIFQTNYILRGVMVPAGGHIVRFEYRPMSLYAGAGLGILSFLVLILVTFSGMARSRRELADKRRC